MYPSMTNTYFDSDFLNNPRPTGRCDLSSAMVLHEDLRKEYVWAGDDLVWTGRLVYKEFLPIPNEIDRTPPYFYDPEPVEDARPHPFLYQDMTQGE